MIRKCGGFMLETILLAFIVAKLKGYNISNIFKNWAIYPVLVLELCVWISQIMIFNNNYSMIKFAAVLKALYLCSYLGLIFKYDLYRQALIGSGFVLAGGLLNDIAIRLNKGFMPVFPTLSYVTGYVKENTFDIVNDIHILGGPETKVKILTDFIDLGYSVLSIGDVLIRVFVFMIIYSSIRTSYNSHMKERIKC